jgi:hypothetical protein
MVQLHSFLPLSLDGGERSTPRPGHFKPRKEPLYLLNRRLGGPEPDWTFRRKRSLVPAGIRTPDRATSNDYAISADVKTGDINRNHYDLND